ncbi:hypothetical protein FHW69_000515 [Luteibacter sp. Sphag1AF]|uniref:M90 family metallopeptidase n=1 Tax=Luteibacter sp. Sphag1AF TaxID=2587031 RepID=UPI0018164B44|nr:hypothetical protein [Luteibacter sp. Sphag1AF]
MIERLRRFFQRFQKPPVPIDDALWRHALSRVPLARELPPARQAKLRELATLFLHRKRFHPVAGAELDDYWRLVIAMQACLTVLNKSARALDGWTNVIVYPGQFSVRRNHHDRAGVVHEHDDTLIGEAWERGPLVLSLNDVALDLEAPHDGYNVIVHEMAHKLDMLAGHASGVPPLPPTIRRREWIETMQRGFDRLSRDVQRGHHTHIDPYAAEAPEEYFAVTSELHFSNPERLAEAEPAVARLLSLYYDKP